MSLGNVGNGELQGVADKAEIPLISQGDVQTSTSTATLTAAQVTGRLLVANPSTSAATYTLPTATLIDALVSNASTDQAFDLNIVNLGTSSGAITIAAGTGITLVGSATIAVTSSATLRFRKTGDAAYTVYRIG